MDDVAKRTPPCERREEETGLHRVATTRSHGRDGLDLSLRTYSLHWVIGRMSGGVKGCTHISYCSARLAIYFSVVGAAD
jgi:hypothetical protein